MKHIKKQLKIIESISNDPDAKRLWINGTADQEFIVRNNGTYCLIDRNSVDDNAIARIACPGYAFFDRLKISFLDKTIILG
jgi:hypothetical protein